MLSDRLREETHEAHITVEKLIVPRIKRLDSNHSYYRLLSLFYGYFNPVEQQVEQYIDKAVLFDIAERRKSETLLTDITFLEEPPPTVISHDLPAIQTVGEALGAMYVLEGSTLGGKFISKMIAEKLKLHTLDGLRFFTGYGASSTEKWETFKQALNNFTNDSIVENEVIAAANQTFAKFKNWIETN